MIAYDATEELPEGMCVGRGDHSDTNVSWGVYNIIVVYMR